MKKEFANVGLHAYVFHLYSKYVHENRSYQFTSCLDIGCGTGAWLARFKERGFNRLLGLDLQKREMPESVDFKMVNFDRGEKLPLGKYDVVTCLEVIEHIENIGHLLDLIRDTLSNDGVAIITTPNPESLRWRVRYLFSGRPPFFDEKSDPTHIQPIFFNALEKLLAKRRLRIKSVFQYPASRTESLSFSLPVRLLASFLRMFFQDTLFGDNTIYFIEHANSPE